MSSSTWARRGLSTLILSFPVAVWATDNLYSVFKVRGTSMEPALRDGDVVLVRKSDLLPGLVLGKPEDETQRARILLMEGGHLQRQATLIARPPVVLAGQVVVFCNPSTAFPMEYNIKRVAALGGQMIRPTNRFRRVESVPPFCLWLEGDNPDNSLDSTTYGPISKKLLVGPAERVLWPPSRWGTVGRALQPEGRVWWPY